MSTFKRKTLNAAVAAGLGAMAVAGSAGAVQLSQDGTGQVLIYPYYTTRTAGDGEYNTYINVVNTTKQVKALKVRFLEGKNSREVLDFNLYLSPRDVWAAAIKPTADGAGISVTPTSDNSCVTSKGGLYASQQAGVSFNFTNVAYTGVSSDLGTTTGWDGADTSMDRTREGYIEIIEMGMIDNVSATETPSYVAPTVAGFNLATGVTHNASGVPANCGRIAGISALDMYPGDGGIMGGASIINVNNGSDFAYDPVTLEDFNTGSVIWNAPGSILPDMTNAAPISNVFYYHYAPVAAAWVTDVVTNNWAANVDAVSAVLMRNSVMNTYILDAATSSSTDWVVTFPTKRNYISANAPAGVTPDPNGVRSLAPFANGTTFFWNGLCNTVSMTMWDREEATKGSTSVEVSPPVPGAAPNRLCWEANVITVANSAPASVTDTLFGSKNGLAVTTTYEHGWAKLAFTDAFANIPAARNIEGTLFTGLPVVGFMAHDFINPNVTINGLPSASSYGGNFNHRYTRSISGAMVTP